MTWRPSAGTAAVHVPADAQAAGDDRRELLRIDDRLLLEYWRPGDAGGQGPSVSDPQADEAIKAFIARPTAELLSRAAAQGAEGTGPTEALVVPWLMKIDWALELILKALVRMHPQGLAMPVPVNVNISGGGLCFEARERFQENECLELRLILPPFVPIRSAVEVIRVEPAGGGTDRDGVHLVAVRFTSISTEDRERVIRHILRLQAERIRARHLNAAYPRSGDG